MMYAVRIVWNFLLLIPVAGASWMIVPKLSLWFSNPRLLRPVTIAHGFEGFGLLLVVATGGLSFSSCFWNRTTYLWRLAFGIVWATLILGTVAVVMVVSPNFDVHGSDSDYVLFAIATSLLFFAMVVLGRSYPSLAIAAWNWFKPRPSEPETN